MCNTQIIKIEKTMYVFMYVSYIHTIYIHIYIMYTFYM